MRRLLLSSGPLVLAAAWLGPLPGLARHSFAAHMTMHMMVVAVAAPLIALALAGSRFDPVLVKPRLFAPIPLSLAELIVVWLWHAPALHHAARHQSAMLILEQGTFLAAGLLVWLAAFGGERPRDSNRTGAGIVALLLTSMHMTLLGALLALAPRPLYAHAAPAELTPLADQHLGGAIMLVAGGAAYLIGGLGLMAGLMRRMARPMERR